MPCVQPHILEDHGLSESRIASVHHPTPPVSPKPAGAQVSAPDWFLDMPIISAGPTLGFTIGIFWFVRQLWRAIQLEAAEAERLENQ
jgi:hypothetical protein